MRRSLLQQFKQLKDEDCNEERTQLFRIKIQAKKARVDLLFDSESQANLIVEDLVKKLGLKTYDHPHPYPLGWVHNDAKLQVIKQCKLRFAINANFIDEVTIDVVPLDKCDLVFGSPYMFDGNAIYYRKKNKYRVIKGRTTCDVHAHKSKKKILLVTTNS